MDINSNINDNFLNIKKIGKNLYKELELISIKRIGKNLELGPTFYKKIGENSYKKLRPTLTKKIGKSSNKRLGPSFIYNNRYLKKKIVILIKKTNSTIYEPKTYDEAIADLIHSIRWQ